MCFVGCAPLLNKADEGPRSVCLQIATAGFAKNRHDVGEKVKQRGAWAASE